MGVAGIIILVLLTSQLLRFMSQLERGLPSSAAAKASSIFQPRGSAAACSLWTVLSTPAGMCLGANGTADGNAAETGRCFRCQRQAYARAQG